jgi:AraC-like DNA-binding protein
MTLTFTQSDWDELRDGTAQSSPNGLNDVEMNRVETLARLPMNLGSGYSRSFDLAPGVWLSLVDWNFQQDVSLKAPVHDHALQTMVFLSGAIDSSIHSTLGKTRAYFSGSGISPEYSDRYPVNQRLTWVDVEVEPELLESTFGELRSPLKSVLLKGEDWKASFYPKVTPAMRSLAQQIWNAPYCGATQQMYLYGKVWELLAMQIELVIADQANAGAVAQFRPDTIAKLHYAKEILTQQLEHPPSIPELARQVEVSNRTLLRGFRRLFGTTPTGYLTQQRMQLARQLLREGDWTVAEVARMVGYGHLGHFATAFRRQFGMNPRECMKGAS